MLLTVPGADTTGSHMKVFARLSRKLVHDEFRESIQHAATAAEVHGVLATALSL
jgi:mannitol/fructose-specific phosphotransferase system IIA component (Ntr-type)